MIGDSWHAEIAMARRASSEGKFVLKSRVIAGDPDRISTVSGLVLASLNDFDSILRSAKREAAYTRRRYLNPSLENFKCSLTARKAPMRRLHASLTGPSDFDFGTSSRTSRLAYGGFRFLLQTWDESVRKASVDERASSPNRVVFGRLACFRYFVDAAAQIPIWMTTAFGWDHQRMGRQMQRYRNLCSCKLPA